MNQQNHNPKNSVPKDYVPKNYIPRLKHKYQEEIVKELIRKFDYQNQYQVPKLQKIVINMGVKDANTDTKKIKDAQNELSIIAGQKAVTTKAKKAIAGFKIRKGMDIGTKVTLRKNKMYEFLDRFINIALPRVQDFRGLNKNSFDKKGNFNCGIKEQIVFPEIEYDKVDTVRGMDVAICTTAKNDAEALELLKLFGMPFGNKN